MWDKFSCPSQGSVTGWTPRWRVSVIVESNLLLRWHIGMLGEYPTPSYAANKAVW